MPRRGPGKMLSVGILGLSILIGLSAATAPETVQGLSLGGLEGALFAAVMYYRERRESGLWWAQLFLIGLLLRFAMALLHIAVGLWFYGGAVDFTGYHQNAVNTGRLILSGELDAFLNRDAVNLLSAMLYFLTGPGLVGMFLLSAIIGFGGSYLFLRAFQEGFGHAGDQRFMALSIFLLPTFAYWTSLLGKDSWIFLFMGMATYCVARLLREIRLSALVGLAMSLGVVTLLRAPVGAIMVLGLGCAWCLKRPRSAAGSVLRPVTFAIFVVAFVGVVYWTVSSFVVTGADVEAGLRYAIVRHTVLSSADPSSGRSSLAPREIEPTLSGLLRYLPEGSFTFLFRPFIFEAHHAFALAAALESTFLLLLVFWRRRHLLRAIRSVLVRPFLAYAAITFVALTVMLSFERNFGVIVRHRAMALPFLLMLLAVIPSHRLGGLLSTRTAGLRTG